MEVIFDASGSGSSSRSGSNSSGSSGAEIISTQVAVVTIGRGGG